MNSAIPSNSNSAKPTAYYVIISIFTHTGAAISGALIFFAVFYLGGFLASNVRLEYETFVVIYLSMFFIVFLMLGLIFGFLRSRSGWILGVSLASLPIIFWSFMYISEAASKIKHFPDGVKIFHYTLPILAGGVLGAFLGSNLKRRLKRRRAFIKTSNSLNQ